MTKMNQFRRINNGPSLLDDRHARCPYPGDYHRLSGMNDVFAYPTGSSSHRPVEWAISIACVVVIGVMVAISFLMGP